MSIAQTQSTLATDSIKSLQHRIRKLETAGRRDDAKVMTTGCDGLDQLLPDRGLATGTITEWLAPSTGVGAEWLSLQAAREACADGGALVIVDPENRFYPVAADVQGINLENTIVLKGTDRRLSRDLLWAIDQSLRCPAVAAVWGRLGDVGERWLRRFQLSAEQSGAMGMFVRPLGVKQQPGWSDIQWEVCHVRGNQDETRGALPAVPDNPPDLRQPRMTAPMRYARRKILQSSPSFDRLLRLRLLRVRCGQASIGKTVNVRIDFSTGEMHTVTETHEQTSPSQLAKKYSLREASQLACPATGRRQRRA